MHRQHGVSGFPSAAGFLGEKPNKRPRMEGPQTGRAYAEMKLPAAEVTGEEEEVWEELDDDAMDECMTLATQMCTEPFEDHENTSSSQTNNHNESLNLQNKVVDSRYNHRNEQVAVKRLVIDSTGDSGFSGSKENGLNNSRIFHNPVRTKKTNAYSSRFNDFAMLSNSQKFNNSLSKPNQSSGKVYNSIPIKGGPSIAPSSKGTMMGSSKNPQHSFRESTTDGKTRVVEDSKANIQEDILLKQGEISVLRAELQRKEAALESERLDRCTAIEAAERRGREKAAAITLEAESKAKDCRKMIEKLQGELHFKNREVQELETQCRRLEIKLQQHGSSPACKNQREPTTLKLSPGKSLSNFKDRFDFSGSAMSTKSVEVQTETVSKDGKKRHKLGVTSSRGKGCGSRQIACLFSAEVEGDGSEPLSQYKGRWTIDSNWANLFSQIITDYEDRDEVQKQLLNLSVQRLEEVHVLLISDRMDVLRSPSLKSANHMEVYESLVTAALSVMKCLTSCFEDHSQKAIQAVCLHLPPLSVKDTIVNNRIWPLVLQALSQLSRITPSQMEVELCNHILEKLKKCCENVNTNKRLICLLQLLQALTHHKNFLNSLCRIEGSCFISKLCLIFNGQLEDHLIIATTLQEWLSMVLMGSPNWLYSSCTCPAKLLATLLRQMHFTFNSTRYEKGSQNTGFSKLLVSTIRLLHCWSTSDSMWWEKVAYLPHYTAVMGSVINSAKRIQADRQTVDLLCDLYEFDEKILENCG